MTDTHVLIGMQLRSAVTQCGAGTHEVDLSAYTMEEIRHPIVSGMIDEFRPLYTFRIDQQNHSVTIAWAPDHTRTAPQARTNRSLTSRLTSGMNSRFSLQ